MFCDVKGLQLVSNLFNLILSWVLLVSVIFIEILDLSKEKMFNCNMVSVKFV